MITVTGLIELGDCNDEPYVFVRYKNNVSFDECLETAKFVYEFTFEYDDRLDEYQIASVKKISKAKAKRNKK